MSKKSAVTQTEAPAAADASEAEPESTASQTHVYSDGSSVHGRPPWPKLSPLQRAKGEPKDEPQD